MQAFLSIHVIIGASIGFALLSLCIAATSIYVSKRQIAALRRFLDVKLLSVDEQSKRLLSGSIGLGERVLLLESRLEKLNASQEELKTSDSDFTYTQAFRMLEQGLDNRRVAANCGLTESEVQLMSLMQSAKPEPAVLRAKSSNEYLSVASVQ